MSIKKTLFRNLLNLPGWRTRRKIVVIESDDWGSVRMASGSAHKSLLNKGYPVDKNPFNMYDALESNEDLEALLEILISVNDKNGANAKFTLNNVVANPDFDKIKESGFTKYFYEPFTETLKKYPSHNRVMDIYHDGIEKKIFKPQFHGREHLNVYRWMKDLKLGNKALHDAFELKMYSLHYEDNPPYTNEYLDSLDIDSHEQLIMQFEMLKQGIDLFSKIWNFTPESFIANCYVWHPEHERVLKTNGIKYIQGIANQFIPTEKPGYSYKKAYHFQGQKNSFGQRYLLRNVFFEPYQKPDFDWVNYCLSRINIAFKWNKPAIISTHRVNFIGFIDEKFRDDNLKTFFLLLKRIKNKWPEVEFMFSDELGRLMDAS